MRRFVFSSAFVILALGVGMWLGNAPRERTAYDTERTAMALEFSRSMLPFKIAFRVGLGAVLLLTLGGLGWGVVRWLHRRADTVYPDRAGLYPIREGRVGMTKVFHDPNRTLTGTTVYTPDDREINVHHAMPEGQEIAQRQVTGQAQAAQALRAAVSGFVPLQTAQHLPTELFSERRLSQPLPEVRVLDIEPSHIDRLLETGESDD